MFNQNKEEITKFLKEINQAFGSLDSLVKLMEGINNKAMSPEQKQTLSKMTGLSPITTNKETSWLFNFSFVDEAGDVFMAVTDKQSKEWVGIKWTTEGIEVYNKTQSYTTKYTNTYHKTFPSIDGDVMFPSIKADVTINFNGKTVPFKAQTSLSLVEHDGQYRLLGAMTIDGVTAETPLIHTHLGMINQSPVLTNLLNRLEVQKQRQSSQQFNQQPCFTSPTPNPIPQQHFNPYGSHPSFGPTPYPPQQPYGQDITLMRIMEQLYSLSEKVDLLLKKQ